MEILTKVGLLQFLEIKVEPDILVVISHQFSELVKELQMGSREIGGD